MTRLMNGLDEFLERDQDRALFNLAPRQDSDQIATNTTDLPAVFRTWWCGASVSSGLTVLCVLTTKRHQQPDDAGGVSRGRSAGGVTARERSGLAHQPAWTQPPAKRAGDGVRHGQATP